MPLTLFGTHLKGLEPIVVIVCGEAGVSLRLFDEWKKKVADS